VVVVVAMAEKKKLGELVESFHHTFGRRDNNACPTSQIIQLSTSDATEKGTEYFIDMKASGKSSVDYSDIDPFLITTHNSQFSFTVPMEILMQNDILPGHTAYINVHEVAKVTTTSTDFVDDSRVIGRTSVIANYKTSDGCRSSLRDEKIYEQIGEGELNLKFRNLANGKETNVVTSRRDGGKNEFTFPISARKALDAEPRDLIEVIDEGESENVNADSSQELAKEEKINEMYEMISELYDAYTAAKND